MTIIKIKIDTDEILPALKEELDKLGVRYHIDEDSNRDITSADKKAKLLDEKKK